MFPGSGPNACVLDLVITCPCRSIIAEPVWFFIGFVTRTYPTYTQRLRSGERCPANATTDRLPGSARPSAQVRRCSLLGRLGPVHEAELTKALIGPSNLIPESLRTRKWLDSRGGPAGVPAVSFKLLRKFRFWPSHRASGQRCRRAGTTHPAAHGCRARFAARPEAFRFTPSNPLGMKGFSCARQSVR